jgi:uncharacterized membrane protein
MGSGRYILEPARYLFNSTWVVEASAERAFDVLRDYETHPRWWQHIRTTRRSDGGTAVRYEIQSPLLYWLRFDVELEEAVRPRLIATRATGDLDGNGVWQLRQDDGVTTITHSWDVSTTKPWMNAVAPIAGPAFRWAHDRTMERGARGLAAVLGARLLDWN